MSDFYEIVDDEDISALITPVRVDEVKAWCRITNNLDNALLEGLCLASTLGLQGYCNRIFIEKKFLGYFQNVIHSRYEPYPFIVLKRSPVILDADIYSITFTIDSEDITLTKDTQYLVKRSSGFTRIWFTDTIDYDRNVPYPIKVSFKAGYGDETKVPDDIKTAIKAYAAYMYENRGDIETGKSRLIPDDVKRYLAPGRRIMETCV